MIVYVYKKICNIARRVAQSNPVSVSVLHFPMEHADEMMEHADSASRSDEKTSAKRRNYQRSILKLWQNEPETCCQKHLLRTHVSPMFPSFTTRETLFLTAKRVFASLHKHFFASGNTVYLLEKLGNIGETCVRRNCFWQHVSNTLARFARP